MACISFLLCFYISAHVYISVNVRLYICMFELKRVGKHIHMALARANLWRDKRAEKTEMNYCNCKTVGHYAKIQ